MNNVIVLIGAGSIGQAIARRVGAGKRVLLADLRPENADAAAKVLGDAGFEVSTAVVDVAARESVTVPLLVRDRVRRDVYLGVALVYDGRGAGPLNLGERHSHSARGTTHNYSLAACVLTFSAGFCLPLR